MRGGNDGDGIGDDDGDVDSGDGDGGDDDDEDSGNGGSGGDDDSNSLYYQGNIIAVCMY